MQYLAHLISILFHPLFIPTYAIIILLWSNPYMFGGIESAHARFIVGTSVLYSILYPLFTFFLMKTLGFVNSYQVKDRKERILVYMSTSFFFTWSFIVFYKTNYNEVLSDVMLGATIALSIALVAIAVYNKISAHAIGMGGLLAVALYAINLSINDITSIFLATIVIAGLVGTSRLILQAHQAKEVYAGYMVGFICQAFAFLI